MRDRHDYLLSHPFEQRTGNDVIFEVCPAKINVINGSQFVIYAVTME